MIKLLPWAVAGIAATFLIAQEADGASRISRLTVRGPAYGTPLNPVPGAKIILIDPDAISPASEPLYDCARPNCAFMWGKQDGTLVYNPGKSR